MNKALANAGVSVMLWYYSHGEQISMVLEHGYKALGIVFLVLSCRRLLKDSKKKKDPD